MNPSKAWAMLAARGLQPGHMTGGRPQLTAAEIARLLQGLEPGRFLMGMAAEAGDIGAIPELEKCLLSEIGELAQDMRWRVSIAQRGAYYPSLAGLAIHEALDPRPENCSTCHTRGYIHTGAQPVPCFDCGQTGGHPLAPHRRAYLVGIAYTSWREAWSERYEQVHAVACGWHGDALSHLRKALEALSSQTIEAARPLTQSVGIT